MLGAALVLQGCAAAGPVVLVSGRDDHGLMERPALALQRSPQDRTVAGSVPDGRFARILRSEGPWRLVRAIAPTGAEGWIEDHYLRGEALRTDVTPSRRVTLQDGEVRDGAAWIQVRDGGSDAWVPATVLREVGAR